MARKVTVPDEDEVERIVSPEIIEAPDMGDLEVLIDESRDWKWHVYRHKSQDELAKNSRGQPQVYVTTLHGKVDLADFHQRFGGGDYEFKGYISGLRGVQERVRTELEGPHKPPVIVFDPPTPTVAQPQSTISGVVSDQSLLLQRIIDRLDRLERRPEPTTVAQGLNIGEVVKLMTMMQPAQQPPMEFLKEAVGLIKLGADTTREVGSEASPKTPGEVMFERALPAIERLATAVMTQRRPPPRPASAAVVEDQIVTPPPATPPPAEPTVDINAARWMTLVDSLSRAIARDDDPQAFAGTVEDLLTDDEVTLMTGADTGSVMAELIAAAGPHAELLRSDKARSFVERVLAEINNPTE